MPFSTADLLNGLCLPIVVSAVVCFSLNRFVPHRFLASLVPTTALVTGFESGYWSLSLGPLAPTAHWHWLPFLMLVPVVLAAVSGEGKNLAQNLCLYVPAVIGAAWFLVPDWKTLEPSRMAHMVTWSIAVLTLAMCLQPMYERISIGVLNTTLTLIMATASVIVLLSGNLRFAQIAIAGVGSMVGITLAAMRSNRIGGNGGFAFGYLLLLCGTLLIGQVNSFSNVPLISYVMVAIAPLGLWLTEFGPVSKWTGAKRKLAQLGMPLVICLAAVTLAALAD